MAQKWEVVKYIICSLILFTGFISKSQILKVDRAEVHSDSSYWSGSIDFKFNLNNQAATVDENITFVGTQLGADLSYIGKKHLYMLVNQLQYFSTGTGPFVSTGFAHFRVNWLRDSKVSYETFTQMQYDAGRNMQSRFLYGGGLRLSLIQAEKSYFHAGFGLMYEDERWEDFEDVIVERQIWKTTNYIGANFAFNDANSLHTTFYFQTGKDTVDDVYRTRISGDIGLQFSISDKLSFTTNFALQYEDRPIIPINNIVYSLTNGLRLKF